MNLRTLTDSELIRLCESQTLSEREAELFSRLTKAMYKVDGQVAGLEQELEDATDRVRWLEDDIDDLEHDLSKLQSKYNDMQKRLKEIKDCVDKNT